MRVPCTRLRVVERRRDAAAPRSGRDDDEPAQALRRAQTVAISRFAPPGHGSLATARWIVQPPLNELIESDLARVALSERVRSDQPEAAARPKQLRPLAG